MNVLRFILSLVLILASVLLIVFVLMHKGKGGGLSDMFGGGVAAGAGSSGVAEKNLNRITVGLAISWGVTILLLGLIEKVSS